MTATIIDFPIVNRSPAKNPLSRKELLRQKFGPEDVATHTSSQRRQPLREIVMEAVIEAVAACRKRDPDSDPAA